MRTGIVVEVTAAERDRLEAIVADRNSPQKHVWRAGIVLATADGLGTVAIMRHTAKSKTVVWRWQERFAQEGVDGLLRDKTRPSRVKPFGPEVAERIVALTLAEPPGETTHWTGRAMAKVTGVSLSYVQRVWRSHGLQPHRIRTFKLSNDPQFAAKVRDIVGLYVDPPAHAVVLSVDEKSQIQALDRTQPGLPMKKGIFHVRLSLGGDLLKSTRPSHRWRLVLCFEPSSLEDAPGMLRALVGDAQGIFSYR
jgi:transposase